METTKNELSPYEKEFFNKLGKYLDTKIYFYGSIQRDDYFPGKSDIDVDVFADNEQSIIFKLQNFLSVKKYDFNKFIYKLHKSNKIVTGYKVQYSDNNLSTEISIYNEKDKNLILLEHRSKISLPFYVLYFLIFLKYFYYKLGIIAEPTYKNIKRFLINYMLEGEDVEFVTTNIPKHKPNKDNNI